MNGHQKSESPIVAVKPANKVEQSTTELVEPRGGAEENTVQPATYRTPSRVNVTQGLGRVRQVFAVKHPRWKPGAVVPHAGFCAGGAG